MPIESASEFLLAVPKSVSSYQTTPYRMYLLAACIRAASLPANLVEKLRDRAYEVITTGTLYPYGDDYHDAFCQRVCAIMRSYGYNDVSPASLVFPSGERRQHEDIFQYFELTDRLHPYQREGAGVHCLTLEFPTSLDQLVPEDPIETSFNLNETAVSLPRPSIQQLLDEDFYREYFSDNNYKFTRFVDDLYPMLSARERIEFVESYLLAKRKIKEFNRFDFMFYLLNKFQEKEAKEKIIEEKIETIVLTNKEEKSLSRYMLDIDIGKLFNNTMRNKNILAELSKALMVGNKVLVLNMIKNISNIFVDVPLKRYSIFFQTIIVQKFCEYYSQLNEELPRLEWSNALLAQIIQEPRLRIEGNPLFLEKCREHYPQCFAGSKWSFRLFNHSPQRGNSGQENNRLH